MRVSREQALASRQRIIDKSAQLFRERGFEGIGIADLMKSSGMTQGGFYRHFSSKDDLAKEAATAAYQQLASQTEGRSVEALLTRYISTAHRDELATGCPTAALGADAMRQAEPIRAVFAEGVQTWLDLIDEAVRKDVQVSGEERRALSIDLAARAVGAIVMSRAAGSNAALSEEILRTCLSEGLRAAGCRSE